MYLTLKRLLSLAPLGLSLFYAPEAAAQGGSCGLFYPLVISADPVAFGTYLTTNSSPTTANGNITIACSNQTIGFYLPNFNVALSAGLSAGFSQRTMGNGTSRLNYNLYTSAAYSSIWGDGSGGSSVRSYAGTGNYFSTSLTVFGRVPASQVVAAGNFSDTITVTVTY
jgi:spore coat protein U-like protein